MFSLPLLGMPKMIPRISRDVLSSVVAFVFPPSNFFVLGKWLRRKWFNRRRMPPMWGPPGHHGNPRHQFRFSLIHHLPSASDVLCHEMANDNIDCHTYEISKSATKKLPMPHRIASDLCFPSWLIWLKRHCCCWHPERNHNILTEELEEQQCYPDDYLIWIWIWIIVIRKTLIGVWKKTKHNVVMRRCVKRKRPNGQNIAGQC